MSDRLLKESDVLKIAFQLPFVVNSAFVNAVKALPSADRPQGEWVNVKISISGDSSAECSLCGAVVHNNFSNVINFCPNCGADMRGGRK